MNLFIVNPLGTPFTIEELGTLSLRRVLFSFFTRQLTRGELQYLHRKGVEVFIDSGAHSLVHGKKVTATDMEAFAKSYVEYIKYGYEYITHFADLDIEQVVGQDNVDKWAKMMDAVDPEKKLVRVWHPHYHDLVRWDKYCKDYPMVGMGGKWKQKAWLPERELIRMVKEAYDKGIKVHGFGCMSDLLTRVPLYSADAISWKAAWMWGGDVRVGLSEARRLTTHKVKVPTGILTGKEKCVIAVQEIMRQKKILTDLWKSRGINWEAK